MMLAYRTCEIHDKATKTACTDKQKPNKSNFNENFFFNCFRSEKNMIRPNPGPFGAKVTALPLGIVQENLEIVMIQL